MGQSPFARSPSTITAQSNRRRSTRLDLVIPIIISGRNASAQAYREATETVAVSANGAALKTRNPIPIGTQVMVENLWEGIAEKAICVRVLESEPGQEQHFIAIQLLHPRNIWGVKDPPADWQFALGPTEQAPAQVAAPAVSGPGMGANLPAAETATPTQVSAAPLRPDLEQRASELVESALILLRRQVAEILHQSLKEFEERLKAMESEAQKRMARRSEEAWANAENSIHPLGQKMLEQITAQAEQAVSFAEESIRERVAELISPRSKSTPDLPPEKKGGPGPAELA